MFQTPSSVNQDSWSISVVLPDTLFSESCNGWQLGLLDGHALRVAAYSFVTAEALGFDEQRCQEIRIASAFHDIGKLMLPDEILSKPGVLTAEERVRVEAHTFYGYEILRGSGHAIMEKAAEIALYHHEEVDGTGYSYGLLAPEISLFARIASVTDVFDALSSDRPYRLALTEAEALELLWQGSGSHFDEHVLRAFKAALNVYPNLVHRLRGFSESYPVSQKFIATSQFS